MRLREIEIRDFRKLQHTYISGLVDGANVIAGDNEAGKSTLLVALQTALFQRYNVAGRLLESMQPFGCTVRPEVTVVFDLEGGVYHLKKTFGGSSARAELTCPGGKRLANHDVDRQLEELLRFQGSTRGAVDFQKLGIWPLFWVEQGTTFQGMNINPDVRTTVQSSLRKEVGDILVGENGARLRDRIGLAYSEYFTDTTAKPRGALAAAERRVSEFREQLKNKCSDLDKFNATIESLESNLGRLSELSAPNIRAALQRELVEAEERLRRVEGLGQVKQAAEQKLNLGQVLLRQMQAGVDRRQEIIAECNRLETALDRLRQHQTTAQDEFGPLEEETAKALEGLSQSRSALSAASALLNRANRVHEYLGLKRQHDIDAERLSKARIAIERVRAAERIAAAIRISEKDLKELRALEAAVSRAEAHLTAAATRLEFHLVRDEAIQFNGGPLPSENPVIISDAAVIDIALHGSIRVVPGGETLRDRRSDFEHAQTTLRTALSVTGAGSLADAEESYRLKDEATRELKTQREVLASLAPEGIAELEAAIEALAGRISNLAEGLDLTGLPNEEIADTQRRECAAHVHSLESELRQAESALDRLRNRRDAAGAHLTGLQGEYRHALSTFERARTLLSAERTKSADLELQAKLQELREAVSQHEQALAAAAIQYQRADPDAAAEHLNMSRASITNLDLEIQRLEKATERSKGFLESIEKIGLGEQCAALQADLTDAELRHDLLNRDAQSLRLLYHTIRTTERDANARFLQPVVNAVQPYLKRVLPGTKIRFGADLAIDGVDRGNNAEPYACLSVGAREQLSVLTRIAFADLLASEGVTAPIILDDALVYSDNARFNDTLVALSLASKRHQIIILTCHKERYLKMGAPIICFENCFSSSAA